MSHPHLPPPVIYAADMGAMFTIIGSFFGILPGICALLGAAWYATLLWDRFFGKKTD